MSIRGKQFGACWAFVAVLMALFPANLSGQGGKYDPVEWTLTLEPRTAAPGGRLLGRFTAKIEPGWHLYSPTTPAGGPIPTQLELAGSPAVADWKVFQPEPVTKFDPNFQFDTETYDEEAGFLFDIKLAEDAELGETALQAKARYQVCSDRLCLPPRTKEASAALRLVAESASAPPAIPRDYQEAVPATEPATGAGSPEPSAGAEPVSAAGSEGLFQFAAVAFGFGILAIFTPCVFPMIPITMSYFVSTQAESTQENAKRASLIQATVFCLGVIVLFTGLGAVVSAVLGPFGTVQLGSNVWVNLFIALIFMVFAASLFGAFEITVPSGAMTKLNAISGRGGIIGTLVMGLVFALASFACTGPFVGALLAGSIQGGLGWPVFGMLMFATGMVLPFFFLAMFPAYLSRLPRSGGWLARTKRTMAFLILAAAFKYLSNVDMMYQFELLTRERFLAVWIVLLALAGLYSLGILRLPDDEEEAPGLGRLALGGVFLIIAVSLLPGMFGARLGELDAYVPPVEYSGFRAATLGSGNPARVEWLKNDYQGALALAKEQDKRVLVSFTGYTCTNCHWMKANMFTKPEIVEASDNLVLVELYTDGADEVSEKNQQLQSNRFETIAIPYYAILRPDESVVAEFPGLTRSVQEFERFLRSGI